MTAIDWLRAKTPSAVRPFLGRVHHIVDNHLTSDRRFIERQFVQVFGRLPDLEHPRTFNEKVQWRKLYDRRPIHRTMVDKIAMRDFVTERLGPGHEVPLLGVYDDPDDIPWPDLPIPCVIKASHGSGWNVFVFDPADADRAKLSRRLRRWLRTDFFYQAREWGYKGIPRKIIIEPFLGTGRETPDDFKVLCFDGVPHSVSVSQDRFGRQLATWYGIDLVPLPYRVVDRPPSTIRLNAEEWAHMLNAAEKLSAGFDFVRVDLYYVEGRVYCGELTLYPGAGLEPLDPPEGDEWLGTFWKLPSPDLR